MTTIEFPIDEDVWVEDVTGFNARFVATRVDLVQLIRDGIPPRTFLPASEGMLLPAKRHYVPGAKKTGKSISFLAHSVDMVHAGAVVAILDRENGGDEYARRLEPIIAARGLDTTAQDVLAQNLRYYAFPQLRDKDGPDLAAYLAGVDLVIFDSQRTFLSTLGLGEDGADDYAAFCEAALEPLSRAGIATLILDNTGHAEPKRGRGSSAKGDLNEILFTLETVERFDLDTTGRLRLEISHSRFGTTGRWEMRIGGGTFQPWQPVDADETTPAEGFRPTALMDRVLDHVNQPWYQPATRSALANAVTGKRAFVLRATDVLLFERRLRLDESNKVVPVPDVPGYVPGTGHLGGTGTYPTPGAGTGNASTAQPAIPVADEQNDGDRGALG